MYTIKEILELEVAPALGCTEPAAVALCTAAAASLLKDQAITLLEVWLSPNIYKNAFAVAIPGTNGATGIDLAAALGFYGGDPTLKLKVLEPVDSADIAQAQQLIKQGCVKIHLLKEKQGIYVHCELKTDNDVAMATVEGTHDQLTQLNLNGQDIVDHPLLSDSSGSSNSLDPLESFLREQSLSELLTLVEGMDQDDYEFVSQGVECNTALAKHGLTYGNGLGIGKTLHRLVREGLLKRDMALDARLMTSSASDARMAGVKLPAMSSAGSGNHGLTAILPIWAVKNHLKDIPNQDALKAVALSHVVTAYIKAHTGRLSAICGCSVAAGAGAAAGITHLMGGHLNHIAGAIKNLISDLAGVICDGAKASCSLKLATAAGTAVQSALFSLHGINVGQQDGIVSFSSEQTMKNVGAISTQGMIETDHTILQIMLEKQFSCPETNCTLCQQPETSTNNGKTKEA